jgi:hypothetical protein
VPVHCRMRVFDRDLIRGGHYGQRSCEPHLKAEHMAAPAASAKKALANSEPSTHGIYRTFHDVRFYAATGTNADIERTGSSILVISARRSTDSPPQGARATLSAE